VRSLRRALQQPAGVERPHEARHWPLHAKLAQGKQLDRAAGKGGGGGDVVGPPRLCVAEEAALGLQLRRPLSLELRLDRTRLVQRRSGRR